MDKSKVENFLRSVRYARFRMQTCERRVREIKDRCEKCTSSWSQEPKGGSSDIHKDSMLIALAEKQTELDRLILELQRTEEKVEAFVRDIDDFRYQAILTFRYVDSMTWPQVREELRKIGLPYSERQMFYIHDRALKEAADLMELKGDDL